MIDPYDPPHADGPTDADEIPDPQGQIPWLGDADVANDWRSDFSLVTEDPD